MGPLQILGILLAISVAGNAFLGRAYLGQRDVATTVKTETVFVRAAAEECSKGTDALAAAGKKRAAEAAPRRAAAASEARKHDAKADELLTTPPAVPGDACKSAEAVVDAWWKGRNP